MSNEKEIKKSDQTEEKKKNELNESDLDKAVGGRGNASAGSTTYVPPAGTTN